MLAHLKAPLIPACRRRIQNLTLEPRNALHGSLKVDSPLGDFQFALPRSVYTWSPSATIPAKVRLPAKKTWDTLRGFHLSIQWEISENGATSFLEHAYAVWQSGTRLECAKHTPSFYAKIFRKMFNQCENT